MDPSSRRRPTPDEIRAANGGSVPDLLAPGLAVLFCGINPSLYSVAVGHHFARPGNRFWPTLHLAGFTDRVLAPHEDALLLDLGYGLTNVVPRGTAVAAELAPREYAEGGALLVEKLRRFRPRWLAILGVEAYRRAFAQPRAAMGRQPRRVGDTPVWVLPNPSGLNAHYQLPELARAYAEFRQAALEPA
jgi:TDG/mug DNA glycosylase family protein